MKTIEKRADEYIGHSLDIDEPSSVTAKRFAFIAGAKSEHEKLTRWHDPKDYPPERMEVLCKRESCLGRLQYVTAYYHRSLGYVSDGRIYSIIGWREIHE